MKFLLAACLLLTSFPLHAQAPAPRHHLMPAPAKITHQDGRLGLDANFTAAMSGHSDDRLRNGIYRAIRRLEGRIGSALPRTLGAPESAKLVVEVKGAGKTTPALDEDESYTLDITPQRATLKANTVVGALRGLETLLQLFTFDPGGYYFPAVSIQDAPRFPWRGLLIDVGRHYQPMDVLKRNLDAMAAVKLNVMHWHLTEDQGFRIESKKYTKLHQMGSDGLFYTQEEARKIIEYARERGIRVVPEFDMPGHVQAWLVGHPELAAAPGPHTISRRWGIMDAAFDPTKEEVYKLLDGFLGEMAKLFPDAYMHIGGDENNGKWWDANPKIVEFRKKKGLKDNHALQAYFNQRVLKILQKHGKRMMGWDEILHPDLPKDALIQSWRNTEAMVQAANQGYDSILSAPYYIDLLHPASFHYKDVIADESQLTPEQRKHILGGEATMWAEWVTPETIDSRIWPRTAAIAEKFWSLPGTTDVDDMYRRLETVSLRLEELGLTHRKNRAMMLRRITGGSNTALLERFLEFVEPVKGYRRGRLQPGEGAYYPLTQLVDAANTDAPGGHRLRWSLDELLEQAPRFSSTQDLSTQFAEWQRLSADLQPVLEQNPQLRAAVPLSLQLSRVAGIGLEALAYLRGGQVPTEDWVRTSRAALDQAAQTTIPLELAVLAPVRELVAAAAEVPRLSSMEKVQWRQHVKQQAAPPQRPR